jgi:hypothetical protein
MFFFRVFQKPCNSRLLILAILFSFISGTTCAQLYEKESFGKEMARRSEFGAGMIITSASFNFNYLAIADTLVADTSMSFNAKPSKFAYRLRWGSGRSLATFNGRSALVLSYGLSYDYLQWGIPELIVDSMKRQFSFFSHTFGSELFFDYKTGAEATLDPDKRLSFNIGAGVLPAYTRTNGDNNSKKLLFTMRPAVRAELGFATSYINFKVQAMGIWGNVTYVNATAVTRMVNADKGLSESYDVQIKGKSQFVLSLVLSPGTRFWAH